MPFKPPKLPAQAVLCQTGLEDFISANVVTVLDADAHGITIACQAISQRLLGVAGNKRPAWMKGTSALFVPWTSVSFLIYEPPAE